MKAKNILFALFVTSFFTFTSCEDNNDNSYSVPSSYTFERAEVSTVNYSGQTTRLMMLDEMGNYIKTNATAMTTVDDIVLSEMFNNTNNQFSNPSLNTSGKQIKDKTSASYDYFSLYYGGGSIVEQASVRDFFEAQFDNANQASMGNTASAGVSGYYIDGSSTRLFDENGLEPQQVILKGLMGACLLDQISNNYLSINKLDSGDNKVNNTNKVFEDGTNYTTMEHAWDEAFGYVYGADNTTITPNVFKFWSSYINQVDEDSDFGTLKENIEKAFIKGRAAIVANDYSTRNNQINIIREKLALVPAVRSVFYLQEGKGKLTVDNGAKAFHALSEAYGFIMSLRYTNKPGTDNPYFSKAEVDAMLSNLTAGTNGFWDVDYLNTKLDEISNQIATRFGFTVEQAATVN